MCYILLWNEKKPFLVATLANASFLHPLWPCWGHERNWKRRLIIYFSCHIFPRWKKVGGLLINYLCNPKVRVIVVSRQSGLEWRRNPYRINCQTRENSEMGEEFPLYLLLPKGIKERLYRRRPFHFFPDFSDFFKNFLAHESLLLSLFIILFCVNRNS